MARLTRAFLLASTERYASVLITLASTAVLSRLLTPAEFGVAIIGFAASAVAEGVRELGASNYIVQAKVLDRPALRSVFTINALLTVVLAAGLFVAAPFIAGFYRMPQLDVFMRVFALGFALGPVSAPAGALMARNLEFGRRSGVVLAVTLVNVGVSIGLAMRGHGYMSFAWAYVISNGFSSIAYPLLLRQRELFGFSLRHWRSVLTFGLFGGTTRLLGIATENAAFLVIGRFLSPAGIGLLYRAGMVATFPDRVLLGAATTIALPAFSDSARRGDPLGRAYVRGVELLTAVHWPAIVVIGLLAHPIISVFLGRQWGETAAYVQIMAGAALFNAATSLNNPIQVAAGAIRLTPGLAMFQAAITLLCIAIAAPHGAAAIAWSTWVSAPVTVTASVWLVHRLAPFSLGEFASKLLKSGAVALGAGLGPLALIIVHGHSRLPPLLALAALALAGLGWLATLAATKHPLLAEMAAFAQRARARLAAG